MPNTESRAPRRARAPDVPRQLEVFLRFFIGVEINGRYYDGMEVGEGARGQHCG